MPRNSDPTASPTPEEQERHAAHGVEKSIHRWEFDSLRKDVKDIKDAFLGKNPMLGDGFIAEHNDMKKKVKFVMHVAGLALIGVLGILGKAAWEKLTKP